MLQPFRREAARAEVQPEVLGPLLAEDRLESDLRRRAIGEDAVPHRSAQDLLLLSVLRRHRLLRVDNGGHYVPERLRLRRPTLAAASLPDSSRFLRSLRRFLRNPFAFAFCGRCSYLRRLTGSLTIAFARADSHLFCGGVELRRLVAQPLDQAPRHTGLNGRGSLSIPATQLGGAAAAAGAVVLAALFFETPQDLRQTGVCVTFVHRLGRMAGAFKALAVQPGARKGARSPSSGSGSGRCCHLCGIIPSPSDAPLTQAASGAQAQCLNSKWSRA